MPFQNTSLAQRSMRRVILTAAASVLALAVSTVTTRTASAQEAGLDLGTKAPVVTMEMLDGSSMDLGTIIGRKPMVIEFWATWCPLCKKLEPAMAAARAKYGKDVAFIGVGVPQNQTPERQQAFVTQQQMTGTYGFDRDGAIYKAYKATHTSYVVVVDAKGTVVYTGVGPEQDIDAAVRKAMPVGKRSSN